MKIDYPAAEEIPCLRQLWREAFGDSEQFLDGFFSEGFAPDRCRYLTAAGNVLAALYWFDVSCRGQKMAYLYALATTRTCRGRGLCRALMENTRVLLMQRGYTAMLLVPDGEGLRQMYGRMGFENCGGIRMLSAKAAGEPISLRQIHAGEFASLRRQYLPEGSVLQEGPSLTCLETFGSFYAGEDFLLVGTMEAGNFRGMELLGTPSFAGRILKTLGCDRGDFQAPGKMPFAMWSPLTENAERPNYFGLDLS